MTDYEILLAKAKQQSITHPKTNAEYILGMVIKVKMNGVWTECMTYSPLPYSGQTFCRALDDFKKFHTTVGEGGRTDGTEQGIPGPDYGCNLTPTL